MKVETTLPLQKEARIMSYYGKGGGWRRQFIGVSGVFETYFGTCLNFFHGQSVNTILSHIGYCVS